MRILKAYLQYKFTARESPRYRFLKWQLQEVGRSSMGFSMLRLARVVSQFPARYFGSEITSRSFTKFDWLVFFSSRSKYGTFENEYSRASDTSEHVRATRFNHLWVSGDTQGVYCFCFSFISYWRNDFFSQCTFYIYHSIQWWKLENQLVKLVNINHFKIKNIRIEIGTAVTPLLKADKESGRLVVFNGMFWSENQSDFCDRSIFGNPGTVSEIGRTLRQKFSRTGGRSFWLLLNFPEGIGHGTRKQSNNNVRTWSTDIHEVNVVGQPC